MQDASQTDWLRELVRIMAVLRGPGGCPWDHEQTHASIKPCLLEEAAELLDAIDDGDDAEMVEELGDVLLQVVFHARIAEEEGRFGIQDAARHICEKLKRRHPHVFGEAQAETSLAVLRQWDAIKATEKPGADASPLARVPRHLPALQRAQEMLKKARKARPEERFVADDIADVGRAVGALKKADASGDRAAVDAALGDAFFTLAAYARRHDLCAENALRAALRRFEAEFAAK